MSARVFTSLETAGTGDAPRRWGSFLAATAVTGLLLAAAWGQHSTPVKKEAPVEITFVEELPAPAPLPVKAKLAPAAAAPVVPKHLKKIVVATPPPVKPLESPTQTDDTPLPEADPSLDKGVVVVGEAAGDPAGVEGGSADGVAGGIVQPVQATAAGPAEELPDDAEPPQPLDDNRIPEYPAAAKESRKTGLVLLRIVVDETGSVGDIKVLKGESPFVETALEAVKTWRYRPAKRGGQVLRVFRLVKIPFHLNG